MEPDPKEVKQLPITLSSPTGSGSDEFLMKDALTLGIIKLEDVRAQMETLRTEKILALHTYKIWEGKDGKWYSYLPDPTKEDKRRKLKKNTETELKKAIVAFYEAAAAEEQRNRNTLRTLYPKWLELKAAHTNATGSIQRLDADWKRYYLPYPDIIDTPVRDLTVQDLDLWIHSVIKTFSMTKTCYYNMSVIIRQCMDMAVDQGILTSNTFRKVKIQTKMLRRNVKKDDETQVFLIDETEQVFNAALKDLERNPDNTAPLAVMLAFVTGLRRGEIVALKEEDISVNTLQVRRMERVNYSCKGTDQVSYAGQSVVDATKTPAGTRSVPLIPAARKILEMVQEINRRNGWYDEGFLFLNEKGKRMTSWQVKYRIRKYCEDCGIKPKSFHKIRKTYISALVDAHVSINSIRKACGHVDERTTLNNYCYNRRTRSETEAQFNEALIDENGLLGIPFAASDR